LLGLKYRDVVAIEFKNNDVFCMPRLYYFIQKNKINVYTNCKIELSRGKHSPFFGKFQIIKNEFAQHLEIVCWNYTKIKDNKKYFSPTATGNRTRFRKIIGHLTFLMKFGFY
jgi:hypothetical protein